jgi:predicted homoserine dehydrogenase-like protein
MTTRVGIIGSGYISKGLVQVLLQSDDLTPSRVLTRSDTRGRDDYPQPGLLTNDLATVFTESDVIVECSGDVVHATEVVDAALNEGLPVVTMDAEMQVTTGSYFVGRGILTEAEGDQPGCLAALAEEVRGMGFSPLVYGNIKGFLNHNPTRQEMEYWGAKQGLSMERVVSFTDGTKLQLEQALVANGLGATIVQDGLIGPEGEKVGDAVGRFASAAEALGRPIADYVLSAASPPGVFIVAAHRDEQRRYLRNYKLGEGPYYLLLRNYHLCHLEIPRTLRRVMGGGGVLLDNSSLPEVSIAAVAKHALQPGDRIEHGIGSFDLRGIAVRFSASLGHCPIGLLQGATVLREVEEGRMLSMDDVEVPESHALRAWKEIRDRVASGGSRAR